MTVALIFGGRGYEREVSISGARFVYPLIPREKYDVIPVLITADGRWLIREEDLHTSEKTGLTTGEKGTPELPEREDFKIPVAPINLGDRRGLISDGGFVPIDVAFPLLHGDFGEDGVVQGSLENAAIKFVGEDTLTSAICLDKRMTHLVAEHLSIPAAHCLFADAGESVSEARSRAESCLGYPMFIKPSDLGSSVGASPAPRGIEFDLALTKARSLSKRGVLIEELVNIESELEIGVLVSKGKQIFTNIGKIQAQSGFYDYKEKYESGSSALVDDSPRIDESHTQKVHEYAERLARFLGLRSLSRIDFFLTRDGEILFNEINTMPGFTGGSLYPRLAAGIGYTPEKLIDTLISEALL